jgi:nucleotide-binding universal stress UspA family protein
MAASERPFVVVVGVDGSKDARTAAEWALREATVHHGRLVVVHTWSLPVFESGPGMLSAISFEHVQRAAEQLLAEEAAHLRAVDSGPEIETRLAYGSPITVLLEMAADASMVVVGSRGMGRVVGLLLGSVSQAVVTRADCPVLVVPPATGKQS